jgi:fibronectin-binding autotransporter adhesin
MIDTINPLKLNMKMTQLTRSPAQTLATFVALLSLTGAALAQSGTWITPNGGSWAVSSNWLGGIIAQGTDNTADFSTLNLGADATVTLDGTRTIGHLIFGDRSHAHNWFLNTGSSGTLTFSGSATATTITVTNQTATISAELEGTQGLSQDGNGTLILVESPGYAEGTTNNAGTLEFLSSLDTSNNPDFNAPLVVNGVVQSAATLNLDVTDNNNAGSINVMGSGTLELVSTNSSTTNADLFFAPDAVANDYYGAAIAMSTLDLGSSQRYIFALTEHNAVAKYDPYEDARIDGNIIGAGGITYIAQNQYTGGAPMECPLVLAGSNTFTGMVEIQRGSIYLFNPQALAQTNKLLMDPVSTNNARLFLYGNGATVADLESAGVGNPLIANGNVNNPIPIAPATLIVNETSNTVFGGVIVDGQYEYDGGTQPPGPLSLVKNGPGTLTLTGANTYTGSNAVNQGELVISAAQTGGGAFSLANGTALGITDIDGNSVTMSDLALGSNADTTLEFTFSGKPIAFLAPLITSSLEANGGANSVTISIGVIGGGIPVGQFPLIQYTSGSIGGSGSGFGAFHLGTLPNGVVASLVNNTASNSIDLSVTTGTAAPSQNGTWINPHGGSWANAADWQNGDIAQGIGYTADFSTLSLTANATVTLDGALSIGNLIFGDQGNAFDWILNTGSGGPLTLRGSSTPSITVNNQTATIGVSLAGTQGLTQNGNGTLVLVQPVGYTGGTTNSAGTLAFLSSLNTFDNSTFNTPLSINGLVQSGATLNLNVAQNNSAGSINVMGSGTLRLIGTTNSSSSPDLFFGPDAVANDYYGAAIGATTLDLGSSQRYIFALTEHNSVSQYDPYEDARIDANIIGSGGITYIAQNQYTGGSPMECPLVLAGANTFAGEVEIQRGSIYLLNAQALVQTNELLIDPETTNNARLFLYGNGAVVGNLESSGAGNALIANGNANNPNTIAPATLTVYQTSNTIFGGVLVDGQYEYDAGTLPPGPLSLVKNGPGTLMLTGPNTYPGSTTVNGGELDVSANQTGGGPFSVANGATLGFIGIYANTVGLSDLALSNGILAFTFTGSPVVFQSPVTTASLEANGGANSVTINVAGNGTGIPPGQFPLIQYTSGSIGGTGAGFSAFHLGTLPNGVVGSLVNDTANNSIDLKVTTGTAPPSQNGTWTNLNGGSWENPANWQGGNMALGIGFTADFSALSLSANTTVTLDGALTIGNLIFGDQANTHDWFLNTGSGGPLTLRDNGSTPSITVNNQIATISVALAGTQGLNQNGNGTLVLVQPVGYTGGTTNIAGTLALLGSLNTYLNTPLSITTEVESGGTLNLDVDQNGSAASINVMGGTLTMIGTNNNSSSPDLYFGPDHNGTDYYGAFLEPGTLDLGAGQRYIFSRSGHNSVSRWLGYEDCRIAANIIGTGGITYIAQMNWPDMEVPLTLFGANTFTGEVEIQRGSIYLMNPQALVQTNKLLLDPGTTNNARFFLYGNGATVANLESSGTGHALIANGNPLNDYFTISPATLTVNQTSNTTFGGVLVDTQAEYDAGTFTSSNLSLIKTGPATLTLTGANTYTGSTAVNAGELVISTQQKGGGPFSVANGAMLGLTNISGDSVAMSDLAVSNSTLDFNFSGSLVESPAPITTATLEAHGGANSVTINISIASEAGSSVTEGQFPLIQYTSGSIGGGGAGFSAFHLGTLPPYLKASLVNNTTNNSIDLNITGVPVKVSSVELLTNGVFSLLLTGTQGTGFTVHATTNLTLTPLSAWTVVGTGTLGSGVTAFDDTTSTNFPYRFYLISTP